MKRVLGNLGYIAAVCALLVGASLLAQSSASSTTRQSAGVVESIDTATMALQVKVDNQVQTILFDASTIFMDHGNKIEASSLDKGDQLKVEWIQRDNKKVAVRVEVVEKAPPASGGAAR